MSLRFGVIGTGGIGHIHLKGLKGAGFNVVALAEPAEAALKSAQELAPNAKTYSDWKELLADPEVDAVNICTINALHFEILQAAVAAGKHVICEKTLTTDGGQAREALKIQPAKGQIIQSAYMKRFFPASIQAKKWLEEIGTPICATVRSFQGGWCDEGIFNDPNWKPGENGEPSRIRFYATGGILNMAGSHMMDMTNFLLGEPASISCTTWSPEGYDAELHAHALFKMKSGVSVHFEAAVSNFHKTGIYENGWDEYIQIDGTKGRVEVNYPLWNQPTNFAARARIYRETTKTWEEFEHQIVDPFQLEMEAFAEACKAGQPVGIPTLRDGLLVDLWIDACYESARTGRQIAFPAI
jgi:predicted dehydrogenase